MDDAFLVGKRASGSQGKRLLSEILSERDLPHWTQVKILQIVGPVWLEPPAESRDLIGWARINVPSAADLRAIHLLALMATYPFFGDVCAAVGRMLRLQGEVTTQDLRSRLRAKWGDREIINVAQRMSINTLRAFGALSAEARSVSCSAEPLPLDKRLDMWAVHALILGRDSQSIDGMEIDVAPEVFFADLDLPAADGYPFLERYPMASGRSEYVLSR